MTRCPQLLGGVPVPEFLNEIYDVIDRGRRLVASDAHVKCNQYISYRVDRRLRTEEGIKPTLEMVRRFIEAEAPEELARLESQGFADFALSFTERKGLERLGRVRINARYAYDRTALNMAVRLHAHRIFFAEEFEIGDYLTREILVPHRGLDLIVAPMGMAKSSLYYAILQTLNDKYGLTITSFEDPIEQALEAKRGSLEQIAIGRDLDNYSDTRVPLRRTDTDVAGYMEGRDREPKRAALQASKSMNVYMTSHAGNAEEAVDEYIQAFPAGEQDEVRAGLAQSLHSVIALRALPRAAGKEIPAEQRNGRQNIRIASEILHVTEGVRNVIRKGETFRLRAQQMGPDREFGSRTLEAHLASLVHGGEIDVKDPLVQREIRHKQNFETELKSLSEGVRRSA